MGENSDSRPCPPPRLEPPLPRTLVVSTCWCLSLSKIWLASRLLCSCSISPLRNTHDAPHSQPLCENVMLSAKPEVHNVSRSRQTRTAPRPYRQHAQKLYSSAVWFSSYASEYIHIRMIRTPLEAKYSEATLRYASYATFYRNRGTTELTSIYLYLFDTTYHT